MAGNNGMKRHPELDFCDSPAGPGDPPYYRLRKRHQTVEVNPGGPWGHVVAFTVPFGSALIALTGERGWKGRIGILEIPSFLPRAGCGRKMAPTGGGRGHGCGEYRLYLVTRMSSR